MERPAWTVADVIEATGARHSAGPGDAVFASVSTDSRTLAAGALFVALAGERFDGHAFADQARARGRAPAWLWTAASSRPARRKDTGT